MDHFSSKFTKYNYLNYKNSGKRAKFSDKWSPKGGGGGG